MSAAPATEAARSSKGTAPVSQPPHLAGLEPLRPRTTPAIIADKLREQIVHGTFAPGSRMIEPKLAERLGVSRGPVREALQRLVQEGLLTNIANRGVFVVELDDADIVDIYRARRLIERDAAQTLYRSKAAAHLARLADIIGEMRHVTDQDDFALIAELDLAFHSALVAAAESPRLSRMFATLAAETRVCLANLREHYPRSSALTDEHLKLLTLISADDEKALLDAVDAHLASAVADLTGGRTTAPSPPNLP